MHALHPQWLIAHQGGWDELILFGVPIVLAVVGVRWAEHRAKAKRTAGELTEEVRTDEERTEEGQAAE